MEHSVIEISNLLILPIIPYKMKNWRRIYFGSLANYENPSNQIPLSYLFYYPMNVRCNSVRQYKIHQSPKND